MKKTKLIYPPFIEIPLFKMKLGILFLSKEMMLNYLERAGDQEGHIEFLTKVEAEGAYLKYVGNMDTIWICSESNKTLDKALKTAFHEFYHYWHELGEKNYYNFERSTEVGAFVISDLLTKLYLVVKSFYPK